MKLKFKEATSVAGWVILSLLNAGFINAYFEHQFDFIGDKHCFHYRTDLAFAIGWSLLPCTTLITPLVTGFYEHGWRLAPRQDCAVIAKEAK